MAKATTVPVSDSVPTLSIWDRPDWLTLLLIGAVLLTFGWSVGNEFVYFDDDKAILYNSALRNPSFGGFFRGQNLGMYAPLTWISYWVGSLISGDEAWGYHLLSLVLHVGNTVLVFRLLGLLRITAPVAFFAALLFGIHPIQAEAVCWAAALSTVLFTSGYLLSGIAYLKYAATGTPRWYVLSLIFFLAACLSKSAAVTLPLLLVAFDYFAENKLKGNFWMSKIPYLIISLIFGLYTFQTRAAEGHDIEATSAAFSALDRFFMVSQTLLFYPFQLMLPLGYSVAYPFVKMEGSWGLSYLLAPAVLGSLVFFTARYLRRNRAYLLGICLYVLPLVVMLPYRTVGSFELRSDRYVYFSSVGIFLILGLLLDRLAVRLRNRLFLAVSLVVGVLGFSQSMVWRDGISLFRNCVEKTPESSLCQCNLGYNALINLKFDEAIAHYTASLKYDPSTIEAYNGRGQAYFQKRKINEAYLDFDRAIRAGISTPKLFLNRGKCLVMMNQTAAAIPDLTKSISLEPKSPEAYYFRAVAREKANDIAGALGDYGDAIKLQPQYLEALVNRGLLLVKTAQYREAIEAYTQALQVNPNLEMIWNNRAFAYLRLGDPGNGVADTEKAIRINPKYARAYQTRGFLYQALGMPALAQENFQMAAQLGMK
jgi:Tfp pilus assembly protein PilF